MTTYYVGIGGNDGSDGLSWVNRKLTLNGVEDVPVAAGDTVYVGPGVYRERLTCDVDGSSGNPITYIGDITGENTDGVGGYVRITGSDDDLTGTRASCIDGNGKDYRTFRGFLFDLPTGQYILLDGSPTNNIIEDCSFGLADNSTNIEGIKIDGLNQANCTIRRCFFMGLNGDSIWFNHSAVVDGAGHLVENCVFLGFGQTGISAILFTRVGGNTVKNCTFMGGAGNAIEISSALSVGQTITVNNCIIAYMRRGFTGKVLGEIIENYNTLYSVASHRTNTATGANSVAQAPLFEMPMLVNGFQVHRGVPWFPGQLSQGSSFIGKVGTGESTDDLFGVPRPTPSAKKSWGAIQAVREDHNETGTVNAGTYSHKLSDAGRIQIIVPVTNESTTFTVQVYREANYAGTAPQLIIKQPGQADDTTTDAGSSGGWNELTTTLTPDAGTDFVIVELVSNNTATSGNYDTFFDDLVVS